jgi:LPS-assembly protein
MAAWTYSVKDRETMDALAGVEYDSCCVALRLVARNYINQNFYGFGPAPTSGNTNLRDNAIMFEVIFKGLGSSGGQIDPLLRRDILGYQ